MANADTPFGMKPIRHLNGMPWNGQVMKCYCATGESNAMYIGDAVDLAGSADADGTCPTITAASTVGLATYPIFGCIVAFEPDPADLTLTYRKASTARYAYVCCDPDVIFEMQGDSTAVIAATAVGTNACVVRGSGSTVTGLSGHELDSGAASTPAANTTFPLMILAAVPKVDNDITAVNAKWQVIITMHRLRTNYDTHASAYTGALGV